MKNSDDTMLVPHEEGFRAWRARGKNVAQPGSESRSRRVGWVALPARTLVSMPMRSQAADPARREAAAQLELEAAGLGNESAIPHNFEVHPLSGDERDQRTATFVQVASLPPAVINEADDAQFAPSVAFHRLQAGEAQVWREEGAFVLAIPHDSGEPLHCQALAARVLDADAAAEIRCILASLELSGVLPNLQSLCVISPQAEPDTVPVSFENALDLTVTLRKEEPPVVPSHGGRLIPAPIVKLRHDRQQRRMVLLGVLAFSFVLVAALSAFGARVALRERAIAQEERRLDALEPELAKIRDARSAWEDLQSAITPDMYPVEAFHQFVLLLPEQNIRLTSFEVREDGISFKGEASTMTHGVQFRERLLAADAFKHLIWSFPQPSTLPDGRASFTVEGMVAGTLAANTGGTEL